LGKVIGADRDKSYQFVKIMEYTKCQWWTLDFQFEECAVPYFQALRAEALLNNHAGGKKP
jgi:hypothetical protein